MQHYYGKLSSHLVCDVQVSDMSDSFQKCKTLEWFCPPLYQLSPVLIQVPEIMTQDHPGLCQARTKLSQGSNHDYDSFRSKCFKIYVPLSQISACIMKLSSTQFAMIIGCRSQHSHLSPDSLCLQEPKVMENQCLRQFMVLTSSEEHLGCNAIILTRSFTYPSSNGSSRCNRIVC